MEEVTSNVANGLCDNDSDDGYDICPFNADSVGDDMGFDDRSDAKGPEPECVATGTLPDGTILSFVGLERSGGIITYDISDPYAPTFQDFLNVRNWQQCDDDLSESETYYDALEDDYSGSITDDDASDYFIRTALNDGPENLVFVPAEDSSIGQPMLLAVAPLAGRLTAYIIEEGSEREDDGSCYCTSSCGYISESDGGTGKFIVDDVCDIVSSDKKSDFGCKSSKKKKKEGLSGAAIGLSVAIPLLALGGVAGSLFAYQKGKSYQKMPQGEAEAEMAEVSTSGNPAQEI
jgi:hypothetical protein